ncbi:hypothetical protein ACFVZ2_14030, partial [Streptomyces lasiicapitis]
MSDETRLIGRQRGPVRRSLARAAVVVGGGPGGRAATSPPPGAAGPAAAASGAEPGSPTVMITWPTSTVVPSG